jgi:hypothetical protein
MLSAERLRTALQSIGWSHRELARRLDHALAFSLLMIDGKRDVPDILLNWIEPIAREIDDIPPPRSDDPEQSGLAPDELRTALDEIGWDFDQGTQRLAGTRAVMARMLDGRRPISAAVAQHLEKVLAVIRAHPLCPEGWGNPN